MHTDICMKTHHTDKDDIYININDLHKFIIENKKGICGLSVSGRILIKRLEDYINNLCQDIDKNCQ